MNKYSIFILLFLVISLTFLWGWSLVESSILADGVLGIGILGVLFALSKYDTKTHKNYGKQNH